MVNKTIGIAGGIGSGKSVVARILRCNGFTVYDCDRQAKILMTRDHSLKQELINELGSFVYDKDGNLQKKYLADKIFNDRNALKVVNKAVHSAVRHDIKAEKKRHTEMFFIESAILATAGLTSECDEIWLVEASIEERIKRVQLRDSLNAEDIIKRMEVQEAENKLLDITKTKVLENDELSPLLKQVLELTDKNINLQTYLLLC